MIELCMFIVILGSIVFFGVTSKILFDEYCKDKIEQCDREKTYRVTEIMCKNYNKIKKVS